MREFNCSLGVLVAAGRLGWLNCKAQLGDFETFRAIYKIAYVQNKLDAIEALSKMPDNDNRVAIHEALRIELEEQANLSFKLWRRLRRYVMNAYTPAERNVKLKAIGRSYLKEAYNFNWTAIESMLIDGSNFIAANKTQLEANNNMPAGTFATDNNTALADFITMKDDFYTAESNAELTTDQVNEFANGVYADLIMMLQDGQAVNDDNKAKQDTYVFEYLTGIIEPTGKSGLKGTATYIIDGKPATGISVELENMDLLVMVDAEGNFDFGKNLASGKDKLVFKKGDEILKEEDVIIPAGTVVTEHVELPKD